MALIECQECKKQLSDQATACPHCGAPKASASIPPSPTAPPKRRGTSPIALVLAGVLAAGGAWYWFENDKTAATRGFKEQSLPLLPIEVKTRQALLGSGLVLAVHNKSSQVIALRVTLTNPTTQMSKAFALNVDPGKVGEIGHVEGWSVAKGDQIEVFNVAFQTWNGSVP
jgi:hypothetical protein